MGRFHFREDDDYEDDDDTDYDSIPSKDPHQQQHRGGRFQFRRSHYGEHEDGEIIEDESCSGNERTASDAYESNHNYQEDRWRSNQDDASQVDAGRNPQPSFRSYLPWRSRRRYSNENSPWSEEEEDDVNGGSGPKKGNKEYRLIASTKYDRNYDRSDFYPTGIDNNHSYESSNNQSNPYTNAVSDDEDDNNNHRDERDAPYGRGSNRSHQQLSRYHPSIGSAVAPEIHYHIYVSDQQASRWFAPSENDGTPRLSQGEGTNPPRRSPLWKRITLWAAVTQLLVFLAGRYNLVTVSPPPSYLTWEAYRSHQFRLVRKVSREGYGLLQHLSKAATRGILGESSDEIETQSASFVTPRYAFPESWKSFVPPQPPHQNFHGAEEHRGSGQTLVFGQEHALEHMQHGLNRWSSSPNREHPSNPSWRQRRQQQQPLVVYVYGGRGVGKGSLAYLILEQLQRLDASDADSTSFASVLEECAAAEAAKDSSLEADGRDHYYCPLLHLTPNDYISRAHDYQNDDDDDTYHSSAESYEGSTMGMTEDGGHLGDDSSSSFVYQTILDHVVAAGGGASIVVLDDVDDSTTQGCEHGAEFCKENHLPGSWWKDVLAEIQSQPAIFGNTIVVLTSHVGTTTVEKWTRKRLQSLAGENKAFGKAVTAAGNGEVEALLRYEVLRYQQGLTMDDWLLIPMAPLERAPMASILQWLADSGPNRHLPNMGEAELAVPREPIVLTEAASDRILDSLEWHQWIHKSSGEVLRVWSPDGALSLVQLWEERLWKSLLGLSNCPTNENENDALLLDFEGSSTDRLWLRSCQLAREGDAGVVKSMDGRRWKCSQETLSSSSCMFYL